MKTTYEFGRRGFTLLELLVVIAIIGILAALLLPVLSRAKSSGSKVTDVNNLKQMTVAMHLYVNDNSGVLPFPNWDDGGLLNGVNQRGWLYGINPDLIGPERFDLKAGVLWHTLHDPKVYVCPSDRPTETARPQQLSSYVMNGVAVGYFRQLKSPLRMSRLSPDACAFWEADETQVSYFNDGASYPKEGVSGRHGRGAVQASFDGSVSHVRLKDWYSMVAEGNRNRLWCYPDSFDGR